MNFYLSRTFCFLVVGVMLPLQFLHSAVACDLSKPFSMQSFGSAGSIFRGKLTAYETRYDGAFKFGLLGFEVLETLSGENRASWTLRWGNSTFVLPDQWDRSKQLVVGVQKTVDFRGIEQLEILQVDCSTPNILDDTPENVEAIKRVLPPKK